MSEGEVRKVFDLKMILMYWPHVLLIVATAIVAARRQRWPLAVGVATLCALIATIFYSVADSETWSFGLYAAEFCPALCR